LRIVEGGKMDFFRKEKGSRRAVTLGRQKRRERGKLRGHGEVLPGRIKPAGQGLGKAFPFFAKGVLSNFQRKDSSNY
jgi:hypothetical protein